MRQAILLLLTSCLGGSAALAGEVEIVDVDIAVIGERTYRFSVTLGHEDTGWDHYADKWEILGPDGTVLGTRILHHPHVEEQPFTRSLSGVAIAAGIAEVTVRAHDNVHGQGAGRTVALPAD